MNSFLERGQSDRESRESERYPLLERHFRLQTKFLADQIIVGIRPSYALRAWDMANRNIFIGDLHDQGS